MDRSQSRFPPPFQGTIPEEFPQSTLNPSHRSKSLDNRRAFLSPQSNDIYYQSQQQPPIQGSYTPTMARRRYYGTNSGGVGRDSFFNDAINIPIQKQPSPRQYKSAVDLKAEQQSKENEEDLWTSYDKTVRYNHERVNYPLKNPPQQNQYYDGYSRGGQLPPITYPESRYPESSEYAPQNPAYNRTATTTNYSDAYRGGSAAPIQQQPQPQDTYRSATAQQQEQYRAAGGGYHQSDLTARHPAPTYDDEYVGDSTFDGRTLGESTDARQHQRGYQQYNKQYQEAGTRSSRQQQQQQKAANGYSHQSYHRRHASGGGGGAQQGFWSGRSKSQAGYGGQPIIGAGPKPMVHHRVRCCCFDFMWPPWGYERCDPPQPIFYTPPTSSHRSRVRTTARSGSGGVLLPPLQPINTANPPPPTDPTNYHPHSPPQRY